MHYLVVSWDVVWTQLLVTTGNTHQAPSKKEPGIFQLISLNKWHDLTVSTLHFTRTS